MPFGQGNNQEAVMNKSLLCLVLAGLAACSSQDKPQVEIWNYQCGDAPLMVRHDTRADMVDFMAGGIMHKLDRVADDEALKYSDGRTLFWNKGATATLEQGGQPLLSACQQSSGPSAVASAAEPVIPAS